MSESVSLLVPAVPPFRGLSCEVGGKYVAAVGGSAAEADVFVGALTDAMAALAHGAAEDAEIELVFRTGTGGVEATIRCQGQSKVVAHALHASKR